MLFLFSIIDFIFKIILSANLINIFYSIIIYILYFNSTLFFNRWGNLVFKSNAYNNDFNGKNLTDGVYFYILSYNNQVFTGSVSLVGGE